MSLWGSFNCSSNAMMAQSNGLNVISQNIANVNTNGYKKVDAEFKTMLSDSSVQTNFFSARMVSRQLVNIQGQVQGTGRSLDLGINGDGFFILGKNALDPSSPGTAVSSTGNLYTRAGSFASQNYSADPTKLIETVLTTSDGHPVLGYEADPVTGVFGKTLGLVKVSKEVMTPVPGSKPPVGTPTKSGGAATTAAIIRGNIDATQPGTVQNINIPITDNAFATQPLSFQWTPVASTPNSWKLTLSSVTGSSIVASPKTEADKDTDKKNTNDYNQVAAVSTASAATAATAVALAAAAILPVPALNAAAAAAQAIAATDAAATATAAATLAASKATITVIFDGSSAIITKNPITTAITWPGTPTSTSNISIDLSKMTQYSGKTQISTFTQDGYEPGYFQGSFFDETGTLTYNFSNGTHKPMYKLPLASFVAPNSLESLSGTLFAESEGSGSPVVGNIGTDGKSSLTVGAVELSNVDIGEEFTKMIITQKAYSTAATAFKTADEMMQSASNLIR